MFALFIGSRESQLSASLFISCLFIGGGVYGLIHFTGAICGLCCIISLLLLYVGGVAVREAVGLGAGEAHGRVVPLIVPVASPSEVLAVAAAGCFINRLLLTGYYYLAAANKGRAVGGYGVRALCKWVHLSVLFDLLVFVFRVCFLCSAS